MSGSNIRERVSREVQLLGAPNAIGMGGSWA
jgi:hypothetical protein